MSENIENQKILGRRKYTHADYNKNYLINETAKRANFTKGDVKIVLNALEDVIFDIIRNKKSFYWRQLFSFRVRPMPNYKKLNAKTGKIIEIIGSIRLTFTPSKFLHKLIETKLEEPMKTDRDEE